MTIGDFIWTDLSSYDVPAARADYGRLFGWAYERGDGYDFAMIGDAPVAGLFQMPAFLARRDMPSFWMSYVHVTQLEESLDRARAHSGAIVEVEPQPFDTNARVALLRDPSGAGFTLYEGPEIAPVAAQHGSPVTRYHHVADLSLIQDFYRDLFQWRFEKLPGTDWTTYQVLHPDGRCIAFVEEVPEDIRGTFSYWMPCFRVSSRLAAVDTCQRDGGMHLFDLPGERVMLHDRQGAHFMVTDI
ncbi:MAG: VOC family protein [Pseudomonadota bacterium]